MKIAVTAKGAGLGAWLDPTFENCLQIVIVDERDRFDARMNPCHVGSSVDLSNLINILVEEKVDALITGSVSSQSLQKLRDSGIQVFQAEKGAILELVEAARRQTLPEII